jgi:hypothetical protein
MSCCEDNKFSTNGWSPVLSVVQIDGRHVFKVVNWIGGNGRKPAIDVYVGYNGYVTDPANAWAILTNVGPQGPQGVQGPQGANGQDGSAGPQGAQGATGSPGAQGAHGGDGTSIEVRWAVNTDPYVPPLLVNSDREPSGWTISQPSYTPPFQHLWRIEARINTDNTLIGTWGTPYRMTGLDGVATGTLNQVVFLRSNTTPARPTGGSYGSPVPTSSPAWSRQPPAGEHQLWMSSRIFSANGQPPQEAQWSEPVALSDTAYMDYAMSDIDANPGNPTDDPANWFEPELADGDEFWLAQRPMSNGEPVNSTGATKGWIIVRLRYDDIEEIGIFKSLVFLRSNTEPATPTGGDYDNPIPTSIPTWSDGVPPGEHQLWMSTRVFTATGLSPQQPAWTVPQAISDTADIDFEFSALPLTTALVDLGNPTSKPENWHDASLATPDDNWMAHRIKKNGEWGSWVIHQIKGEKGENGIDGVGPFIMFTGIFDPGRTYMGTHLHLEAVYWPSEMGGTNKYYYTKVDAGTFLGSDHEPDDVSKWVEFEGQFESVATKLLIAEFAYVKNLGVGSVRTNDTGQRIVIDGPNNLLRFFDSNDASNSPSIEMNTWSETINGVATDFAGLKVKTLAGDSHSRFTSLGLFSNAQAEPWPVLDYSLPSPYIRVINSSITGFSSGSNKSGLIGVNEDGINNNGTNSFGLIIGGRLGVYGRREGDSSPSFNRGVTRKAGAIETVDGIIVGFDSSNIPTVDFIVATHGNSVTLRTDPVHASRVTVKNSGSTGGAGFVQVFATGSNGIVSSQNTVLTSLAIYGGHTVDFMYATNGYWYVVGFNS